MQSEVSTLEVMKGHADLLVLAALGDGPAHGYAIVETVRERSAGVFDLAEGTVYPALYRLVAELSAPATGGVLEFSSVKRRRKSPVSS